MQFDVYEPGDSTYSFQHRVEAMTAQAAIVESASRTNSSTVGWVAVPAGDPEPVLQPSLPTFRQTPLPTFAAAQPATPGPTTARLSDGRVVTFPPLTDDPVQIAANMTRLQAEHDERKALAEKFKHQNAMREINYPTSTEPKPAKRQRSRRSLARRYRAVVWDRSLQISVHVGVYDTPEDRDKAKREAEQRQDMGLPIRID